MARSVSCHLGLTAIGLVATAVCASPAPSSAQEPNAGIIGRVVDLQSRAPIRGARVALLGTPRRSDSDTAGKFTQAGLAAGTYVLQVRALGYNATSWIIRLDDGEVTDTVFELPPLGYNLNPVTVEGRPTLFQQRMREFEERRSAGRGVFVTEAQIRSTKAATLVDVLQGIPGVRLACRLGTCNVEMMRSARGACRADWVVDGFPATQSGTPHLPTVGIVAIEVYRSPGETPTQFLKTDSQCGVIVIWTKSGP